MTNTHLNTTPIHTESYSETISAINSIVSECMYDGIPVDRPSALAAAYSVPDGAPLWMAVANVDIAIRPSDAVCSAHDKHRQINTGNLRAMKRGPR